MNFTSIWNSIKPGLIFAGKVAAGTVVAMATQSAVITVNSTLTDWREDAKAKRRKEERAEEKKQHQAA